MVFRQYGFPQAIRTDSGAPFASLAIGGLSELSKWWIQLSIRPELIKPGKPSQNGQSRGQTVFHWAALDLINIVLLAITGICFDFVILILTDTTR